MVTDKEDILNVICSADVGDVLILSVGTQEEPLEFTVVGPHMRGGNNVVEGQLSVEDVETSSILIEPKSQHVTRLVGIDQNQQHRELGEIVAVEN